MSVFKKFMLLALCLFALQACGVRGDPVPPSQAKSVQQ